MTGSGEAGLKKERSAVWINYCQIDDSGYTSACPWCGARYDADPELVGKERPINLAYCQACQKRAKPKYLKYFYGK